MAETLKSLEIDLPERRELRFILPLERQQQVLPLLHERFEPLIFSDRNITRTIYFNNQNHEVPQDLSLKARQYFHGRTLVGNSSLDASGPYFVEIKAATSEIDRTKKRFEMTLGEASTFLTENAGIPVLTEPLRPLFANEYERFHFTPKAGGSRDTRITCDLAPSYFLIDEDLTLHLLSEESSLRVEIKTAAQQSTPEIGQLVGQLETLGARKTVSKKMAAYSLEVIHHESEAPRPKKEIPGIEIESKLIVTDDNPTAFFSRLRTQMRQGLGNFVIPDEFPYVVESGSFNSYYLPESENETEGVKILVWPTYAKAVLKSEGEIIQDKEGLGCILKRIEVKSESFPIFSRKIDDILKAEETRSGAPIKLVGEIERLRKKFWVCDRKTLRVYHFAMDQCRSRGHDLYELEIEYSGTRGELSSQAEPQIIENITQLTRQIVQTYPSSVRPEPLTKLAWLRSLN